VKKAHRQYLKRNIPIEMSSIPDGICVDLETTIAGKIPDSARPKGQKRYETRLLEVGAVLWRDPTQTFGCLVNPIPSETTLQSREDLFHWLRSNYQKPEVTINFWSRVLVKRDSLTSDMFRRKEAPLVWLGRTAKDKALDFVHWHTHPSDGPDFVTESQALKGLIAFGSGRDWLAHNGKSFDYKVLEGCAQRTGFPIPASVKQHDTLFLFRKMLPGHKSYSQPRLYSALFGQTYNAHVAIDDAKALAHICRHAAGVETRTPRAPKKAASSPRPTLVQSSTTEKAPSPACARVPMQLAFQVRRPRATPLNPPLIGPARTRLAHVPSKTLTRVAHVPPKTLRHIKGIGPKSVAALAALSITTVAGLKEQVNLHGAEWIRDNLPFGVNWRVVSKTIT
tara:strand:+ start:12009 stop:13190 length:1182 start_codon:yes stop_codon:yes gene_type:complete